MELFVMRHGDAVFQAPQDSLRELSDRGRLQVEKAIKANADSLNGLECLIASPYLRAQQSADIICRTLTCKRREQSDLLIPSAHPGALIEELHALYHQQYLNSLMLVSHLPLVGDLIDQLCGSVQGTHKMGTASLAALDFEVMVAGCCQLRWLHHAHV